MEGGGAHVGRDAVQVPHTQPTQSLTFKPSPESSSQLLGRGVSFLFPAYKAVCSTVPHLTAFFSLNVLA